MNHAEDPRQMRRIIAEDPQWNLATVPLLTDLCVKHIISNFNANPILHELLPRHKAKVLENIEVSVPLQVTAHLIADESYWHRCCKARWKICDVSRHGNSWKRMFFEKNLEDMIEKFVPGKTDQSLLHATLALSSSFVQCLNIKQLLPPVREPIKNEAEDDFSDGESEFGENPPLDHFDFNVAVMALPLLEEIHVTYCVSDCGMNFQWSLFEFSPRDCSLLAKALKSCSKMRTFHLHRSKVDDDRLRQLVSSLLDHPSLENLDLSYNQISDKGARALGKLINGRSKLVTLDLTDNRITGQGAAAIAHALGKNSTLKRLSLRLNRLKDDGCQSICRALIKNGTLEEVNLAANEFGETSAPFLAQVLVYNKRLTSINISCNSIGEVGGKTVQEGMEDNSCVTAMDLRLTEIGQECEYAISQMLKKNREAKRKPIA